jgi:integrase
MGSIRRHTQTGALFFDFRYQGMRCREYTALPDSPKNRRRLQAMLDSIEGAIAVSTFNYRQFFPASKNALKFDQAPPEVPLVPIAQAVSSVGENIKKPTPCCCAGQIDHCVRFALTTFDKPNSQSVCGYGGAWP